MARRRVAIARANPRSVDELAALNALGPYRLAQYGEEIIKQLGIRN